MPTPASTPCLLLVAALAAVLSTTVRAEPTPTPQPTPPADSVVVPPINKPKVELVFVLDTTGSMGGLIDGAKRKIWFIVDEILKAKVQPDIKVGLVGYRDQGDQYVTKVTPLSDDLDAVYKDLMAFRAEGGGDEPEDVELALHHALTQQPWTDGKDVLKIIFLVGDAQPKRYEGAVHWEKTAQDAVRRFVYINTIQTGSLEGTQKAWTQIAQSAEGRYARIPQDGGVVAAIETPFDKDLAKLASDLDKTELDWGSAEVRGALAGARASSAAGTGSYGVSALGTRGTAKAKMKRSAKKDLVSYYEDNGSAALGGIKNEELPVELQNKTDAEKQQKLEELKQKRNQIKTEIAEVEKKRSAYISEEKKKKKAPKSEFDDEVIGTIRTQGKGSGLVYEE